MIYNYNLRKDSIVLTNGVYFIEDSFVHFFYSGYREHSKGAAYARWATVYNLKQMVATLQYLQENNLLLHEDLAAKADAATGRFHSASGKLKQTEAAMKHNADLKTAIVDYARTRPIFDEYKARKYSSPISRSMRPIYRFTGRRRLL